MSIYAQLNDQHIVIAISELSGNVNSPDMIELPSYDTSLLGKRYEGGEFIATEQPTVDHVAKTQITRLAFLSRFTDEEAIALDLASIGATVEAATLRRYLSKVNAATFIDLSREDTRAGVLALEPTGILAEGRALEILDAPIQDYEVPR